MFSFRMVIRFYFQKKILARNKTIFIFKYYYKLNKNISGNERDFFSSATRLRISAPLLRYLTCVIRRSILLASVIASTEKQIYTMVSVLNSNYLLFKVFINSYLKKEEILSFKNACNNKRLSSVKKFYYIILMYSVPFFIKLLLTNILNYIRRKSSLTNLIGKQLQIIQTDPPHTFPSFFVSFAIFLKFLTNFGALEIRGRPY